MHWLKPWEPEFGSGIYREVSGMLGEMLNCFWQLLTCYSGKVSPRMQNISTNCLNGLRSYFLLNLYSVLRWNVPKHSKAWISVLPISATTSLLGLRPLPAFPYLQWTDVGVSRWFLPMTKRWCVFMCQYWFHNTAFS